MKRTKITGTVLRKIAFAGSTVQFNYPILCILIVDIQADAAWTRLSGRTSSLQSGNVDSANRATTLRVIVTPLTSLNIPNINGAIAPPPTTMV